MTGEITLRGKVLPIGGVKEKVLAAYRFGIKTILLPKENEKDLAEIPEDISSKLEFRLVENMDEVLETALAEPIPNVQDWRRDEVRDRPGSETPRPTNPVTPLRETPDADHGSSREDRILPFRRRGLQAGGRAAGRRGRTSSSWAAPTSASRR